MDFDLSPGQDEIIAGVQAICGRYDLNGSVSGRAGQIILNNHVTLHSRTEFEDFDEPERKRCLFRLWLAPLDSATLPESWRPAYRSVKAGTVRGGIIGQAYDDTRRAFKSRQAADLGMRLAG